MELDKCLVIPHGAPKRTAKQLEKLYQKTKAESTAPEYAEVECWLVCDNETMPVYCDRTTTEESDNFDFQSFAKETAAKNGDLMAKQAIVRFSHKLYVLPYNWRHVPLAPYYWEFRREIVKL